MSATTLANGTPDDALFRRTPVPAGLDVIDVHLNALGSGIEPAPGFYAAETLAAMQADPGGTGDGADDDAPRFVGGIAAPPAGVELLHASMALQDDLLGTPGWQCWLRLDDEGGQRPPSGPLAQAALRLGADGLLSRVSRRGGTGAGAGAGTGAVAAAIDADPELLARFAGVKLMPQHSGLPGRTTLAHLARHGTPVLVHAGIQCPVSWLERHLLPHLSGPVVLAHLGSWPCSADDLHRAVELASRDARVHLETSGANIGNFLRHAVDRVPERILFGSNRPMCAPRVQFAHVAASVADDATLAAIAHGNAARLFGISVDDAREPCR